MILNKSRGDFYYNLKIKEKSTAGGSKKER